MRTTVRLDDDLLRDAKRLAAQTHRTLTAVIEDALRETLARRTAATPRKRIELPSDTGFGLQPGVDLDDSVALLDLMEAGRSPPRHLLSFEMPSTPKTEWRSKPMHSR